MEETKGKRMKNMKGRNWVKIKKTLIIIYTLKERRDKRERESSEHKWKREW